MALKSRLVVILIVFIALFSAWTIGFVLPSAYPTERKNSLLNKIMEYNTTLDSSEETVSPILAQSEFQKNSTVDLNVNNQNKEVIVNSQTTIPGITTSSSRM